MFVYPAAVLLPPLQRSKIPKPGFLQKRINEVEIGTFKQIATVQESASVFDALTVFVERRVSALPVVSERGGVTSLFVCLLLTEALLRPFINKVFFNLVVRQRISLPSGDEFLLRRMVF